MTVDSKNTTTLHPPVPPLPFDWEALVRAIEEKIEKARASRDQVEATRRTMAAIDVAEVNPDA